MKSVTGTFMYACDQIEYTECTFKGIYLLSDNSLVLGTYTSTLSKHALVNNLSVAIGLLVN